MPQLHVICKNNLHVTRVGPDTYESGYWPISENDAKRLVGGTPCLHDTKAERSRFGGSVESFRHAGAEWPQHPERMIFVFRATLDGRGRRWQGRDNPMDWVGGVIDD